MLINLIPEFLDIAKAPDPLESYHRYLKDHFPVLSAYWHNYVLDLDSPHVEDVIKKALVASRKDLTDLLKNVDLEELVRDTIDRCEDMFEIDSNTDVYLMIGVGGANAGELVVGGRGIAFACIEHFTGKANPETFGLGLSPEKLPLWIAHELAHTVRYLSPTSQGEMASIVRSAGGNYDYWESGSRATLLELLVNEGLAVAASRAAVPGHDACDYLGYGRRQYRRLRELEAFLRTSVSDEFDKRGLGYRLRYLSGGMSSSARLVNDKVIPERAGYYLGHRIVESIVSERGIAGALRSSAEDCLAADQKAAQIQTA